MHTQSLFSMLDRHMQSKSPVPPDAHSRFVEFIVEAEPVCGFLQAVLFEQLCAGCGGQVDPSLLVVVLGQEVLWRHVQGGLGKILHCTRGGGLKVQIDCDPSRTFLAMRRQALYEMASHIFGPG